MKAKKTKIKKDNFKLPKWIANRPMVNIMGKGLGSIIKIVEYCDDGACRDTPISAALMDCDNIDCKHPCECHVVSILKRKPIPKNIVILDHGKGPVLKDPKRVYWCVCAKP